MLIRYSTQSHEICVESKSVIQISGDSLNHESDYVFWHISEFLNLTYMTVVLLLIGDI